MLKVSRIWMMGAPPLGLLGWLTANFGGYTLGFPWWLQLPISIGTGAGAAMGIAYGHRALRRDKLFDAVIKTTERGSWVLDAQSRVICALARRTNGHIDLTKEEMIEAGDWMDRMEIIPDEDGIRILTK